MINLHLSGELAAIVGQEVVELSVSSPREAVLALAYQLPGYRDKLLSDSWHVFVGKGNDITASELDMELGSVTDIYLVPVIEGAVVGAIIVGGLMVGGGLALGVSTAVGLALVAAGAGLLMSGAMMLLTKAPNPGTASASADSNASFLFNGAVNTTSQGDPIPIGYGKMLCGSVVVSAALYAEDI